MKLDLEGKVAIVTGAGQGVGREIAKALAAEGSKVGVNDLFLERANAVATEIINAGGKAMEARADVTNFDQVKSMVLKISESFGPVAILVNNAGVPAEVRGGQIKRTVFVETDPISWNKDINLSLYGCLNCTHAVLKSMIEKKEGKIISIISEAGRVGEYNLAVYSGAKAAVLGFSKALAREVGRHRINVNCVALGATAHEGLNPPLNIDSKPETDPSLQKMLKSYPIGMGLGRIGRPFDVAYAVTFLASPKACFITGQCLSVSGGFTMGG
jgi:2-hydroxycyclohexanecarboxyl-CoA dehydrogenase